MELAGVPIAAVVADDDVVLRNAIVDRTNAVADAAVVHTVTAAVDHRTDHAKLLQHIQAPQRVRATPGNSVRESRPVRELPGNAEEAPWSMPAAARCTEVCGENDWKC